MYSVIVPITINNFTRSDKAKTVEALKKAKVKRVLLALEVVSPEESQQDRVVSLLKDCMEYMKNQGFICGVWFWAFAIKTPNTFTKITGLSGATEENECCPLDDDFRKCQKNFIRKIAALSPDLILFDDDLRFGNFSCGLGCLCENHIKDIQSRVGEQVSREFLREKILHGDGNKYRSAYIDSLGDSLRLFCREMRETVDEVNPDIRIGQCACISSWDIEGASPYELVRILAGKTKPYLRLIGAPYWAHFKSWGNRLQDVIDLERLESAWCEDCDDIEIVSEGDVYPRPRHLIPASYLECFDAVLRSTKSNDGIMKYMMDYSSSPSEYEKGYLAFHNYDAPFFGKIENQFEGLSSCGVNLLIKQRKFRNMTLRETVTEDFIQDAVFPVSARFASANALATVFNGLGEYNSQIIFGEDAKYAEKIDIPTVLDLEAAEILLNKYDLGIKELNGPVQPTEQYFDEFDEYTPCRGNIEAKDLILSEKAEILSYYICGNKKIPAVFKYKNDFGQEFLIMNFTAKYSEEQIYRNYCLQKILVQFTKPLVYCIGNPDLYIYCARKGNKVAVILANLFIDKILKPEINFNVTVKADSFDFNNCFGNVENNKLTLSALGGYEFASFTFETDD